MIQKKVARRRLRVARLTRCGKSCRDIARRLGVTHPTVTNDLRFLAQATVRNLEKKSC